MAKHVELNTGTEVIRSIQVTLRERGLNFEKLADMAKISRPHLSQVLNGGRACTAITWARLEPYLILEERQKLRSSTWNHH